MEGFVYILLCGNGKYYTGSTVNLEIRIAQHQSGLGSNYTREHGVERLVYSEWFPNVSDAFKREKQIQKWSHSKKKALIEGDISGLVRQSKKSVK